MEPPTLPRLTRKLPSYRLHKPSGQAVVTLDGRDLYLGPHGSPESREEYDRAIAEWLSRRSRAGSTPSPAPGQPAAHDLTINELLLAFWQHAERHYRTPSGEPAGELSNFRDTLRPFRKLLGPTDARDFSPRKLKNFRQALIDDGLSRGTINQRIGRIVRIFKWGASEELLPAAIYESLKTVGGLQKGRTDARESEPVRPVAEEHVEAVRPHVSRQVWAMVELQRATGMRPGEVIRMRSRDIDTRPRTWVYIPAEHKTGHLGKGRTIFLGPRARDIVRPWLREAADEPLFQPREAMLELRAEQRRQRKTPLYKSVLARPRKARPKKAAGLLYSPRSYYHAIRKGCVRAGIPPWHPHQLRHNAATLLRREHGIDVARAVLGHTSPAVTEIYAEVDGDKAREVMEQMG